MKMFGARFIQHGCDVPLVPPFRSVKHLAARHPVYLDIAVQQELKSEDACLVIAASKNEIVAV